MRRGECGSKIPHPQEITFAKINNREPSWTRALSGTALSGTLTDPGDVLAHARRAASVPRERGCVHACTLA
jgi:hypothetical protein